MDTKSNNKIIFLAKTSNKQVPNDTQYIKTPFLMNHSEHLELDS